MAASLTPPMEFKCGYEDCARSFGRWDEMNQHVKNPDEHPGYCHPCEYFGANEDDLWYHKIKKMTASLATHSTLDKKARKDFVFEHIVCEFCPMEFGSLSGRSMHQKQQHQADQKIICNASSKVWISETKSFELDVCSQVFASPSLYMRHIEEGRCPHVKPFQLKTQIERKHIRKVIMEAPDKFGENMNRPKQITTASHKSSQSEAYLLEDGLDNDKESSGGVQLMDDDDHTSQALTFRSLEPKKDMTKLMEKLFVNPPAEKGPVPTASNSPRSLTSGAWGAGASSKTLFPGAKPTPLTPNWDAILAAHDRSRREDEKSNMLVTPLWDPSYEGYDPEIFRTGALNEYSCPFHGCEREFTIAADLTSHLRQQHLQFEKKCPVCYKTFKDVTALMQHFESSARGAKCRVAHYENFNEIVHEATGGFLSAQDVYDDKVCTTGERDGVRIHKFTSEAKEVQW